jgi:hypothetical protein
MPGDKKEPQSYGSQQDWVTGNTGGAVNDQKDTPAPEHREFYDERRESETNAPGQGGSVSPHQHAESAQPTGPKTDESNPQTGVTAEESGAKRGGYFKDRDYE